MGLGKSFKKAWKSITEPFIPESAKKPLAAFGGSSWMNMPSEAPEAPAAAPDTSIGTIGEGEAQEIASKRLSRLGRYFTSPLGILGKANSASQRIFS